MASKRLSRKTFSCLCTGTLTLAATAYSQVSGDSPDLIKKAPSPRAGTTEIAHAFAKANLAAKSGSKAGGTVVFSRSNKGIEILINVNDVSRGNHGIHIHEKGDCSAEDASSAGEHFNPTKQKHGAPHTAAHAGDFGNISVASSGVGVLKFVILKNQLPAWDGGKALIGKSIVLHADPDDLKTDPSGNSGARIACGVIEKAP